MFRQPQQQRANQWPTSLSSRSSTCSSPDSSADNDEYSSSDSSNCSGLASDCDASAPSAKPEVRILNHSFGQQNLHLPGRRVVEETKPLSCTRLRAHRNLVGACHGSTAWNRLRTGRRAVLEGCPQVKNNTWF